MEAASCGLPVIYAKGFGLNEFLSSDHAFPVSATLGPIPPGPKSFFGMPEVYQFPGNKWLNPSFTELCEQMRYVFDNQNEARIKGDRAREVMKEKFNWEVVAKRMMSRLKKIEDNMQKKR
jgi:glycosyltransferase involved in cell wall biosynthesis